MFIFLFAARKKTPQFDHAPRATRPIRSQRAPNAAQRYMKLLKAQIRASLNAVAYGG